MVKVRKGKLSREDEIAFLIVQAIKCNKRIKLLMYMSQKFQNLLWVKYGISVFDPQGQTIEDRELYVLYNHIVKLETELKWFWNGYFPEPFQGKDWNKQRRYFKQNEREVQTALEYKPEMWG